MLPNEIVYFYKIRKLIALISLVFVYKSILHFISCFNFLLFIIRYAFVKSFLEKRKSFKDQETLISHELIFVKNMKMM